MLSSKSSIPKCHITARRGVIRFQNRTFPNLSSTPASFRCQRREREVPRSRQAGSRKERNQRARLVLPEGRASPRPSTGESEQPPHGRTRHVFFDLIWPMGQMSRMFHRMEKYLFDSCRGAPAALTLLAPAWRDRRSLVRTQTFCCQPDWNCDYI